MESIGVPTVGGYSYDTRATALEELVERLCIESTRFTARRRDGKTYGRHIV